MGITVGMVGVGDFACHFIPLFQAHPQVEDVALCDIDVEKLRQASHTFGITRTYSSLDVLCDSDVDAAVIITQNWLHGPQAAQALQAGKHVYSAVPTGISVEEIATLIRTVEQTGLIYMLGETSYYYPAVIYCRQRYAAGDFGAIVYGEGDYFHDWDHGLYTVMQRRGGERWREVAGSPPMHYPTHSTSQIISVTGAHMTHVSCQGFVDRASEDFYDPAVNRWHNVFSNQTALFRMSDGSCCRINEFRRIGHPEVVRMNLFGTRATFETNGVGSAWLTKDKAETQLLDNLLAPTQVTTDHGVYNGFSRVHPVDRLPVEYLQLPGGHQGSHHFLVDDFVRACVDRKTPPNNVWMAARYALPGIMAHESALHGGELLEIPDFGAAPETHGMPDAVGGDLMEQKRELHL